MPRAVLKNGVVVPIEPFPQEWADGRELWVHDPKESLENGQALDEWIQEVEKSAAEGDQQDWQEMQAVLDDMHRKAKDQLRCLFKRPSTMHGSRNMSMTEEEN